MFNNNVFYSPHSTPCIYERDDRGVGGVCKKAMRDLNSIKKDLLEAVQAEIEKGIKMASFTCRVTNNLLRVLIHFHQVVVNY